MNTSNYIMLAFILFIIYSVEALNEFPVSSEPSSAIPPSATLLAAQRLQRFFPGRPETVERQVTEALADVHEDTHELMSRLNEKYGLFNAFKDSNAHTIDPPIINKPEEDNSISEDYKQVFQSANVFGFNPEKDNADNLDQILGSLWGKRFAYLASAEKLDDARNQKIITIRGTSPDVEASSIRSSRDGSVSRFYARALDKDNIPSAILEKEANEKPFKPQGYNYGPRLITDAIDVTKEGLDYATKERQPSPPPRPPVESFVIHDNEKIGQPENDNQAPITFIQTIRVSGGDETTHSSPLPEPMFNPNMVDTELKGDTSITWLMKF